MSENEQAPSDQSNDQPSDQPTPQAASVYGQYKILIVEDKFSNSEALRGFFFKQGFDVAYALNAKLALKHAVEKKPNIVIMNLLSDGLNAVEFCEKLSKMDPDTPAKVLVTSDLKTRDNILKAIEAGASDYILMPYKQDDLLNRVKYHLRNVKVIESNELTNVLHDERIEVVFNVLNCLSEGLTPHKTLFKITKHSDKVMTVKRCNIIAGSNLSDVGFVAAASDDPDFEGFKVDLDRYPEVRQVLNTGNVVVIDDIGNDPIMKDIKKEFKNIDFNSILVCPIRFKKQIIGVLAIRAAEETKKFSKEEIKLCQLLAVGAAQPLNFWRFMNKDLFKKS